MNRVIIMGSPRSNGRSARLAEMLFEANIDECPEDELFLVPVSELDIAPCVGCGACRMFSEQGNGAEGGAEAQAAKADESEDGEADDVPDYPYCPRFDDDMQDVYALLPYADELIVVSPVFFSGAPASMKAVLDRLQPHFWAQTRKKGKRPATLHVVGEGGDPHGYGPLVSEVRSALAVAGFKLERVLDWVGKIDASGEITAEADVVEDLSAFAVPTPGALQGDGASGGKPQAASRPKLDLSSSREGSRAVSDAHRDAGRRDSGRKDASASGGQNRRKGAKQGAGGQGGAGKNAAHKGAQKGNGRSAQRGRAGGKQSGKGKRNG